MLRISLSRESTMSKSSSSGISFSSVFARVSCFLRRSSKVLYAFFAKLTSAGLKRTVTMPFTPRMVYSFTPESKVSSIYSSKMRADRCQPSICYSPSVNVTVLPEIAAVPTVRVPPSVTSMGIPINPPPSPPSEEGLTMQDE